MQRGWGWPGPSIEPAAKPQAANTTRANAVPNDHQKRFKKLAWYENNVRVHINAPHQTTTPSLHPRRPSQKSWHEAWPAQKGRKEVGAALRKRDAKRKCCRACDLEHETRHWLASGQSTLQSSQES